MSDTETESPRGRWLDMMLQHRLWFGTCKSCDPSQEPIHTDGRAIECPRCHHRWLGSIDLGADWTKEMPHE